MLLLIILNLSACTIHPINVEMHGSSILNPDEHYRSLPVMVHIYQLTENNQLINANFYDLWKRPKSVLGKTLLKQQTIIINPHEEKILKIKRKKKAKIIAAIAIFRKPISKNWMAYKKLPAAIPYVPTKITFGLTDNRIYIK